MKKFIYVVLMVCGMFICGNSHAQEISLLDDPGNEIDPVLPQPAQAQSMYCLETAAVCEIGFLETVICEIDSLLCFSDENSTEFSWGLAVSMYWGILSEFQMPTAQDIEQNANTAKEKAEFVDGQILGHLICSLDGYLCSKDSGPPRPSQRDSTNESKVCRR